MSSAPRAALAQAISHRPRVGVWLGLAIAVGFALLLLPVITAERWVAPPPVAGEPAPLTVRVPLLAGFDTTARHVGGGVVIARGEPVTAEKAAEIADLDDAMPHGAVLAGALLLLVAVLAAICTHHMRRSTAGRLARIQLASLGAIVVVAVAIKALLLATPISILVVPVALFALVPTLCLDRVTGLATGILAALVLAIEAPFDLGVACLLLVQVAVAGLVVAERPKRRWPAALAAGAAATACTVITFPLLQYLMTGHLPSTEVTAWQAPWLAAAIGPALATVLAVPLVPLYQRLVGEITQGRLVELEDLSNPLLRQIAERAPGTWQHSLAMANLAEIAANSIGANGRLVRVGAYYHDLGKSLQPKYFIENVEPGETSPHDQLPPEVSTQAIFKHVTEGLATARRAGLHERIVDFMHMHHGDGVLEYFWSRCREQGNPSGLTIEDFRYPGVPPQTRETAILAICDAVEAASRTLKRPDASAIDSLVQRIVYGKLHLGQLDDSGLSMADLRRVSDSLRETIRHANHGRIEYPWQRDAAAAPPVAARAPVTSPPLTQTAPRLDSLDRPARPDTVAPPTTEAAAAVDGGGSAPAGSGAEGRRGVVDGGGSAHAGSGAEGRRGVVDGGGSAPAGSGAEGRRGVVDGGGSAHAGSGAEGRRGVVDGGGSAPAGSGAEGRRGVVDMLPHETSGAISIPRTTSAQRMTTAGRAATSSGAPHVSSPEALAATAELRRERAPVNEAALAVDQAAPLRISETAIGETGPALARPSRGERRTGRNRVPTPADSFPIIEQIAAGDSLGELIEPPPPAIPRTPTPKPRALVVEDPPPPPKPRVEILLRAKPPTPGARKRAATLPPIAPRRAPTVPPYFPPPTLDEGGSAPSGSGAEGRRGVVDEGDSAPFGSGAEGRRGVVDGGGSAPFGSGAEGRRGVVDADDPSITEPRLRMPLPAPPEPRYRLPAKPWATGLAARIDAAIDHFEDFGGETPMIPPTAADLRALLGDQPDPTKRQTVEELERLHFEARTREPDEPEILQVRRISPTNEVDPDDIESAIELAPPARRSAIALGIAKKKPPA